MEGGNDRMSQTQINPNNEQLCYDCYGKVETNDRYCRHCGAIIAGNNKCNFGNCKNNAIAVLSNTYCSSIYISMAIKINI